MSDEVILANIDKVGKIWLDMECDGTQEFVNRVMRKSKIDQVIDFYWIPYTKKNDWRTYLKYRIQERHCHIVNDHFLSLFRAESSEESNGFDFGKLQAEYIAAHPTAEHTGINMHVNYEMFKEKDQEHREALQKNGQSTITTDEAQSIMWAMKMMMKEMSDIKNYVGSLSPNIPVNNDNWKETNAPTEVSKTGEITNEVTNWDATSSGNWGSEWTVGWGEQSTENGINDTNTESKLDSLNWWGSDSTINTMSNDTDLWLSASDAIAITLPEWLDSKLGGPDTIQDSWDEEESQWWEATNTNGGQS